MTNADILVIDDTPENLRLVSALLKDRYKVRVATSGAQALELVRRQPPDLILLDIMMPEMDGYEVCRQLKSELDSCSIPVIFLTARNEVDDETHGFELGAVDYITKPISPPILLARVATHLTLKQARDFLVDQNSYLESEVQRRTRQVQQVQDVTIMAMASLAETRDNETGNHILRTQRYVKALAKALQQHPDFAAELNDEVIELLYKSAPLHDIGKVGIPDHILLKPGKLTDDEFEIMKTHTTLGRDAIERAEANLSGNDDFLRYAREIAYCHQEKWDGSGYPQGLREKAIPLSARLMAIADVYDALISKRVYKPAFSHEEALDIMRRGHGSHFDPVICEVFLQMADEFAAIAARFRDEGEQH
ncbi:response regulator [Chitinilyticum piscinae]|uniref:Two-component system response regulator n=1 Tax=Chitinilyticum piscinae TaxID=2866724 RepID=A0A8J7FYP2_9NEIS|nr:two-component system response regulator [Chitinilyticum piscinae]MBE9608780.1 two-component system response regulator [Chitinilyticum piscinae]